MQLSAPDYVILIVADLDRSVTFYADVLGLPLGHRSGPYAQFATGVTRVACYEREAMASTLGMEALRAGALTSSGSGARAVGRRSPYWLTSPVR